MGAKREAGRRRPHHKIVTIDQEVLDWLLTKVVTNLPCESGVAAARAALPVHLSTDPESDVNVELAVALFDRRAGQNDGLACTCTQCALDGSPVQWGWLFDHMPEPILSYMASWCVPRSEVDIMDAGLVAQLLALLAQFIDEAKP